jgi:heme-degrading monooxygenase HmoA
MIAHVRTIRLAPGGLAQAIKTLRDTELVALRQAAGFAGLIVLASLSDSAAGERVEVVSLWDSRLTLDGYATTADQRAQQMPELPPQTAPAEVRVYEVAQSAGMFGGTVSRFISASLDPGHIDTVVSLFENVVMHAATEQRGFRRGLLLVDRETGLVISIGLWHSEADLRASEQGGYLSQQIGNFIQMVTVPIVPETLVVVVEG